MCVLVNVNVVVGSHFVVLVSLKKPAFLLKICLVDVFLSGNFSNLFMIIVLILLIYDFSRTFEKKLYERPVSTKQRP